MGESPSATAMDVQCGTGLEKTMSTRESPAALSKGGSGRTVVRSVKRKPPKEPMQLVGCDGGSTDSHAPFAPGPKPPTGSSCTCVRVTWEALARVCSCQVRLAGGGAAGELELFWYTNSSRMTTAALADTDTKPRRADTTPAGSA